MLVAYHGDPRVKARYLARVAAHRAADELVHGAYWENGKGCAVGCTVHGDSHASYETELGIPQVLAWLEDSLFETLPDEEALRWPEKFLVAIPPGASLALVWPRLAVWLLTDARWGALRLARKPQEKEVIRLVAQAYREMTEENAGAVNWQKIVVDSSSSYPAPVAVAHHAALSAFVSDPAFAGSYACAALNVAAYANEIYITARQAQAAKLLELLVSAPVKPLRPAVPFNKFTVVPLAGDACTAQQFVVTVTGAGGWFTGAKRLFIEQALQEKITKENERSKL